jgi:hypothetical protein
VALVLIVLGGWGWTAYARAQNEHALSAVAADLSGRPVEVGCQSFFGELLDISGNLGDVPFDANGVPAAHTHLVRPVCDDLRHFRDSPTHPPLDCLTAIDWSRWTFEADRHGACVTGARRLAQSLNTLTHEAMHMRGWTSESVAQCYAIQEDLWTVVALGGTEAEGRAVASLILAMQRGMPDEYQSPECRAGGQLDLHPETPEFPGEPLPALPPGGLGPALH